MLQNFSWLFPKNLRCYRILVDYFPKIFSVTEFQLIISQKSSVLHNLGWLFPKKISGVTKFRLIISQKSSVLQNFSWLFPKNLRCYRISVEYFPKNLRCYKISVDDQPKNLRCYKISVDHFPKIFGVTEFQFIISQNFRSLTISVPYFAQHAVLQNPFPKRSMNKLKSMNYTQIPNHPD